MPHAGQTVDSAGFRMFTLIGDGMVAAVVILVSLLLLVVGLLCRFDRITAVTALSTGATGGQSTAVRLRLHRSRMPVHVRLGIMDVVGRWPTYLLLFRVFAVSAFITIVRINSATTVNAPGFINHMGIGRVDLRIDLRHADTASPGQFAQTVEQLTADPDVRTVAPMVTTRHDTVDQDGNAAGLYVENGDHTRLPLTYTDGRAPTDASEIALSLLALNEAGRAVDDTLPLEVGGQTRELTVVGSYQDVTNGGKTAKAMLPTDEEEVMWYMIGVELAPGVDPTDKATAYTAELAPARVADIEQWRSQTLGPIAGQIALTAVVSAVVAIALARLMTALFTRMLVARDAGQIAVQRALGADDAGVRRQYLIRIVLVLVLGVVVGTVAANTFGEQLFNLMFGGMFGGPEALGQGTSHIDFSVHPLLAYLVLPAALLGAVTAAAAASSRAMSHTDISTLTTG